MGYTRTEVDLIAHYLQLGMSILDMGSQNDYTTGEKDPPFVSEWYLMSGITDYTCIDLAGDNNALRIDVSKERDWPRQYDLVVDSGFGEHVVQASEYITVPFHDGYIHSVYPEESTITNKRLGFYNFWVNKHKLCKIGGYIISINPETGSWPEHCYHWINKEFYKHLTLISEYAITALYRDPATGNTTDGWNIVSAIRKNSDHFPSFEEFSTLPIFDK